MKSTKGAHELQQGISRTEKDELKEKGFERSATNLPCYRYAILISNRKFTMVQALGSGHAGSGLSESNPMST